MAKIVCANTLEKQSFYKYASPEATLAILKAQSVRYSSPLLFNDPFDVQSGLHFDFDLSLLHERVLDKIQELAESSDPPKVDENDPWGKIVLMTQHYYPTHGFPRERFEEKFGQLFEGLIEQIEVTQKKYQEHWWKNLLPSLRVFCVSENREDLLMWAHYGKDHTGAVLEFLSLPDEDNALSVAKPVHYVGHPPAFFSESDWIDEILSLRRLDMNKLYMGYVYHKSSHWSYEKEWRVWYPSSAPSTELFEDMSIRQSEFVALYLGCRAEAPFIQQVVSMARKAFPRIKIFKAHKENNAYSLRYESL